MLLTLTGNISVLLMLVKVEFEGLTGHIAFDDHGYRKDYKLDILQMGFNSEPKKVGHYDLYRFFTRLG